jgi:predicted AAA+ superfamily ATPase
MSIGKYISLEEARKQKNIKRFIKEHPSKGDKEQFEDLLHNMTYNIKSKKPSKGAKTSKKG